MSKNLVLVKAGRIFVWLVISIFTKHFDTEYLIVALLGFQIGYLVKKKDKE